METKHNYKEKLLALLEGLDTQHIDEMIEEFDIKDYKAYGELYFAVAQQRVKEAKTAN